MKENFWRKAPPARRSGYLRTFYGSFNNMKDFGFQNKDIQKTEKAFQWIIHILEKHNTPFQITGGLAARAYGSDRPLNDIDIDVPEEKFNQITPDIKDYIIRGPERFIDDKWDLLLMTLKFEGQEIDICGAGIKIRDHNSGEWRNSSTDFSKFEMKEVYGINVPVIRREDLITYKKVLGRKVDQEDVAFLIDID